MTNEMMDFRALVEKSSDADLLREMIGFAAERLMEMEVGGATGAGCGAKSPLRPAQRNGYRERDWETRAGTVERRIPKLRPWRPAGRPAFGDRMIRLLTDHGLLLSELSRAAAHGREGADRGHPSRASRPRDPTLQGSRSGDIDGEAYIQGISTRPVDDLVKAMGMSGISRSQASRRCEAIDGPPRPAGRGPSGNRMNGLLAIHGEGLP